MLAVPWLAGSTLTRGAHSAQAGLKRPNILFIMTDDHAAQAISCYGSKVNRTPHLDRLAGEGIRMDRVFATNSICPVWLVSPFLSSWQTPAGAGCTAMVGKWRGK
jgi:hypothetical protein